MPDLRRFTLDDLNLDRVERATDIPRDHYHGNCHMVAKALVDSGILPEGARVARGFGPGIGSQHSWVTIGDPYDPETTMVDPTAWSWEGNDVEDVMVATVKQAYAMGWCAHGYESTIWEAGRPATAEESGEEAMPLDASALSFDADTFWSLLPGELGRTGWSFLLHAPVRGWPAAEITEAALRQHPSLLAVIPIDRLGMLTDWNPKSLYLPGPENYPEEVA